MSKIVMIMGESGSGKTYAIKGLDPKETFVIASDGELSFQFKKGDYRRFHFEKQPTGNFLITDKFSIVAKAIDYVAKNRPEIKNIVVDDNQYLSLSTFIRRIDERNYFDKFTDIAVNIVQISKLCKSYRKDLIIFFLNHVEVSTDIKGQEKIQVKTMGKFVKEKVTYEGMFKTVLMADKEDDEDGEPSYFFWTRRSNSTVKSPEGMFEEQKIPNNLGIVAEAVRNYNPII